jgi:hypothetical protein
MAVGTILAEIPVIWHGHELAEVSNRMIDRGQPLEAAIWWPFQWVLRGLELGLAWLDVAKAEGAGVKDQSGHWLKPSSLWVQDDTWGAKPGSYSNLMAGPINDPLELLSLATPLGNIHGDSGWMARNYRGVEVELSADAYALLCDANMVPISDVVAQVQKIELSMYSHGRVRKATDELTSKDCMTLERTTDFMKLTATPTPDPAF